MTLPPMCPKCQRDNLVAHCDNRRCSWIRCRSCGGYGTADGTRWIPKSPSGLPDPKD